MTRDEIQKLHTLPKEDQIQWLKDNDVLQPYLIMLDDKIIEDIRYESLADCAFRLKDEVCSPLRSMLTVSVATPIHWIQAALLAKIEKDGE